MTGIPLYILTHLIAYMLGVLTVLGFVLWFFRGVEMLDKIDQGERK
jgi:hypothetical protein